MEFQVKGCCRRAREIPFRFSLDDVPNQYLPLHRPEIQAATGMSSNSVLSAITEDPHQFAPGVVQILHIKGKPRIRFNPFLHITSLRSNNQWQRKLEVHALTDEEKSGGVSGPMAEAEKLGKASETRTSTKSGKRQRAMRFNKPSSLHTADGLIMLEAMTSKTPMVK